MKFAFYFLHYFYEGLVLFFPLILFFIAFITLLGSIVGRIEGWTKFNAIYWSFITALTVGYGDIRPSRKISKVMSIIIAFTGIMFTGLLVALTVATATTAFEDHLYIEKNMTLEELEEATKKRREEYSARFKVKEQ